MPKKVINIDYDEDYDCVHDFEAEKMFKLFFKVGGSKVIHMFQMVCERSYMYELKLKLTTIGLSNFPVECLIRTSKSLFEDVIKPGQEIGLVGFSLWEVHVKITFKKPAAMKQSVAAEQRVVEPSLNKQEFTTIDADLIIFIERGPKVTLVGNDGNVTVPKRLLELRSEALEMILNSDSQEKLTNTIELKDFNSRTLESFASFLMDKKIKDGIETATGLILLGDKYNIQVMKTAAEDFVKENIQAMDKEEVFDVLSLVNKDLMMRAVVYAWSNGY